MTKVALALGSFIVGATFGSFAFSLIHMSTRVQAGQGGGIVIRGAEPVVPSLGPTLHGGGVTGGIQPLDGISCDGCVLVPDSFTYAGGAYQFNNAEVRKNIPITLKGAALNTVNLLRSLGALPSPQPTPQPQDNNQPPIIRAAIELKIQDNFTLVSLEGMKK